MCDHTDTPNVHTLVILLLTDDFGSHVERRAEDLLQPTLWTVVACKSKVSKLEVDSVWIFSFLGSIFNAVLLASLLLARAERARVIFLKIILF